MVEYCYHVDKDDNVIGKVTRKEMREKELLHRAVVVFVFNSKGKILMMKRSDTKDKDPGLHEMAVAGVVDYGEDYDDAARRELKEEIGCDAELTFLFKSIVGRTISKAYKVVFDGPLRLQKSEVESAYFIPFDKLEDEFKKKDFRSATLKLYTKIKNEKT